MLAATFAVAVALVAGCGGGDSPRAAAERARVALAKGDTRVAEQHLKALLQARPDDVEARASLAAVHLAHQEPASAAKEWRRALELGLAADRGVPGLVEALVGIGDARAALEAASATVASAPARASLAYWRGRAHEQSQRPDLAAQAWRDALDAAPDHLPSRVALIEQRARGGDTAGAIAALDAVLARDPVQLDALLAKADAQRARRDDLGARRTLVRALDADAGGLRARKALVPVLVDLGDIAAARDAHAPLRERAPRDADTLYLQALIDVGAKRYDAARDGLYAVLQQRPDDLRALALAGRVAMLQDTVEQAETFARRILDRAPASKDGARLLATVLLRRGEADRALRVARTALERGGDDPALLGLAGEAALRGNDAAGAVAWFERATRLDPDDAPRRAGHGLALLAAGRAEAGFTALQAAVELDASSTQADVALIGARLRAGQHAQALAAVDRMERKQPNQPLASNLRGTVLLARGDPVGARAAFEAALRIEAGYFAAVANLAELDLRDRKPGAARGRLEALAAAEPGNVRVALALAQVLGRTGASPDDVAALLRRTIAAQPRALEPVIALSKVLLDAGRARDAVALLRDAHARHGDDRAVIDALGTALLRAGEPQQAVEAVEHLLRLDPASPLLQVRLAEMRTAAGDTAGARANWRQVAEFEQRDRALDEGLAAMLVRAGRRADGPRIAAQLRERVPQSPAGHALEGDLHAADGRWLDAANAYGRALDVRFGASLAIRRHMALLRSMRPGDAEAMLRDALRTAPSDVALRLHAGEQAIAAGRWKAAVEHYDAVVAVDADHVVALNNLAWSLHALRDARARAVAEDAWRRAPDTAQVADTLATVLLDGADPQRGIALLRRAVELAPDVPRYRLHWAQALARHGDRASARLALAPLLDATVVSPHAEAARALAARL